jgi:hypothetical protein
MKGVWSTFLILVTLSASLVAQNSDSRNIEHQSIFWIKYYNILKLNDHFQLHTELETRRFLEDSRQHQWVMPRMMVQYKFNDQSNIGLGAVYFIHAMPQTEGEPLDRLRYEFRPHQELNLMQGFKKMKLSHRYRIEERFFLANETDPDAFNFRLRYRFQAMIPLVKKEKTLSLRVFDEIMCNAGKEIGPNIFDQNRIFAGVQWKYSDALTFEMGYLNWFQERASGKDYYARDMFGFTLIHTLDPSKKAA